MTGVRAVGYLRVSTAEQAEHGWNLNADRKRIEEIAAEKGYELIEVYDDGGRQGDDPDRPGFIRMLDRLDQTDVILLRSLDRLSRDTSLYAHATRAFRLAGVRVETFTGPVDLESPEGELNGNIMAAIARFEKRQIGVRVKQAMNARAHAGHHHGRAPYGYDARMEIIESQASVIRRIFHQYGVDGVSQREIARTLNRDGTGAQKGQWTQGAISKTLNLPAYIGKVRFNGQVLPGDHEPIITEDLWRKAQQLRNANLPTKRGKATTGQHLLGGGMLACGRCGGGMYAATRVRQGRVTMEQYHCSTRQRKGLDACDQPTVKRQPVDEAVWRFVVDTALDMEASKEAIIERATARLTDLSAIRNQAGRDEALAEARLTRVRTDYQDGKLDAEDWREQRTELTDALDAARAQVQRLGEQRTDLAAEIENIDGEHAVLAQMAALRAAVMGEAQDGTGSVEAFRAVLRRLFVGFELVRFPSFGKSGMGGIIWPQDDRVISADGYVLIPRVRVEAVDWEGEVWGIERTTLAAWTEGMSEHRRSNRGR